jgi:hypothetical protein
MAVALSIAIRRDLHSRMDVILSVKVERNLTSVICFIQHPPLPDSQGINC